MLLSLLLKMDKYRSKWSFYHNKKYKKIEGAHWDNKANYKLIKFNKNLANMIKCMMIILYLSRLELKIQGLE
jgi:hypothetical protein